MTRSSGRAYAGQSADERDALRRARLLDATRELIGTAGYAATTIERICSNASVSTRHFYLLYASKEAVFIDLYDAMISRSIEATMSFWEESEGRPMRDRVPAALIAYVRPFLADPAAARILFVEAMGVSPALERKRQDVRELLVAFVERVGADAVARGEVADRDFRFLSLALIGAAIAIVQDWAAHADHLPVAELERKICDLAVKLIVD